MTIDLVPPSPRPTSHRSSPRDFSSGSVGATARLFALPQLDAGLPPTLAEVDEHLARIERARQAQLDALPAKPGHVVAAAHRGIVEQILAQVQAARVRVREGTYGLCARCAATIGHRVLEREPWQTACGSCDSSSH